MTHRIFKFIYIFLIWANISFISCSKMVIKETISDKKSFPNWTMYGGNPQRTHCYPSTIELPLKLLWQQKVSSAVDKTLLAVDGVIYFCTLDGKINALDIATAEKLSDKKVDHAATCAYFNHQLIIARRYGDETLYNLNLADGNLNWRIDAGDIASEPLPTATSIIVTALYNHVDLYALDSGVKIWTFETDDQIRSSPAMAQGKIVFGCDNGYIYAVDATSGKLIWQFKTNANVPATPTIDLQTQLVFIGSADNNFYALNLTTGTLIWKFQARGKILNGAAISQQRIIFGSTDKTIYCLDNQTGELLWQVSAKSVISTSPVISGNAVFWGSLDHFFYAADLHSGQILWQFITKGRIRTEPIIWGNYFIGASEDYYLYIFKSESSP